MPVAPSPPGSLRPGEREIFENLAFNVVLSSLDMPRQFKPMNLDRENLGGNGGGPDDPDAADKLPVRPIRF